MIDSNIIAQWVLSSEILDTVSNHLKLPKDMVSAYKKRYSNSIEFVNRVLIKADDDKEFYTYDFNLFEVLKSLKDEIRTLYLFENGVPVSRWASRREHQNIVFDDELVEIVFYSYNEAQDLLFNEDKVQLLWHPLADKERNWEEYYSLFSRLLLDVPNLLAQDALIVSACLYNEIEFLITKDGDLKQLNASLKKALKNTELKLRIIDPGNAILNKI